ncbi:hypothetical protein P9112_006338 [Eukaryota sp. TZLM1-RC]
MCLNNVLPPELTAARLVALDKPGKSDKPDGVRPIAIGESLTRLLSSLIFNKISTKATDYLNPFQFGIKTIEGASAASMTSDVFFNIFNAIAKLPKGKAAGPSGNSFDLLKTACKNTPEISEDLAIYFQNLMCLNYVPPPELTAARLVALVKPGKSNKPGGVRPIAIGESLTRLLSSLIFNRISTKQGTI